MNRPGKQDVIDAAARIAGGVVVTPALRSDAIDDRVGATVWLKCESLQRAGAFKARGALNTIAQLTDEEKSLGVITYSSGNHAQAVAWAAARLGVRATLCMPTDAPPIKIAGVERYGGEVILVGTTSPERRERALAIAAETGAIVVEPFDHPRTIAGQGTATLELVGQVEAAGGAPLDALFVPVGGGGLAAGACLALEGSDTAVITAEPVGCDSMFQSLRAGRVVAVSPGPTLADGLKPTEVGALNFEICRERVREARHITDDELRSALRLLAEGAKLAVEPSGAAALAAACQDHDFNHVGVLLSGGNVSADALSRLLAPS